MIFKKNLSKRIRKICRRIQKKYELKLQNERKKFIRIFNHDIKTPLLAQNQVLEMILQENFGQITAFQKEILTETLNSNKFLLETVGNSIFLLKFEEEKPKLKFENINIVDEIQNCIDEIENFAKDKQQNIVFKMDKNCDIKLKADRKFMQKIIYNLLSSSVSTGFENSEIEISLKENKNEISFFAKNKSVYMTKEKIKSLLNENKKSLSDFNQLGMNLNLNVAKKLITAHHGELIANSEKNNSATFGFIINK